MQELREKSWITPDFEVKFREAMGRAMTVQEREFFCLAPEKATPTAPMPCPTSTDPSSHGRLCVVSAR